MGEQLGPAKPGKRVPASRGLTQSPLVQLGWGGIPLAFIALVEHVEAVLGFHILGLHHLELSDRGREELHLLAESTALSVGRGPRGWGGAGGRLEQPQRASARAPRDVTEWGPQSHTQRWLQASVTQGDT